MGTTAVDYLYSGWCSGRRSKYCVYVAKEDEVFISKHSRGCVSRISCVWNTPGTCIIHILDL